MSVIKQGCSEDSSLCCLRCDSPQIVADSAVKAVRLLFSFRLTVITALGEVPGRCRFKTERRVRHPQRRSKQVDCYDCTNLAVLGDARETTELHLGVQTVPEVCLRCCLCAPCSQITEHRYGSRSLLNQKPLFSADRIAVYL